MTSTREQYASALHPLSDILDAAVPGAWDAPSPCEGWTGREVVRHLVETQREFLTSHGADLGDAPDVDADPPAGWRTHTTHVMRALKDQDLVARPFDGHFGPTTVGRALEQFYVWDMYVHRWDLARTAGLDTTLTDRELDLVEQGADGFSDALYMEGICRAGVQAPDGADRTTRLLARLGRSA